MKYILNISIYLSFLKVIKTLHPMISMWSVFYTYTIIECEIGNLNIQHTDPVETNLDIHLPLRDDKLVKLQESDPHKKQLRKQWENKNLDQNMYTIEDNILK